MLCGHCRPTIRNFPWFRPLSAGRARRAIASHSRLQASGTIGPASCSAMQAQRAPWGPCDRPYWRQRTTTAFLAPRNADARNGWPVSFRCPTWRHELRRRGGARLGGDGRWRSIDTQSFHKVRSNKYIGCLIIANTAVGWGKADVRKSGATADRIRRGSRRRMISRGRTSGVGCVSIRPGTLSTACRIRWPMPTPARRSAAPWRGGCHPTRRVPAAAGQPRGALRARAATTRPLRCRRPTRAAQWRRRPGGSPCRGSARAHDMWGVSAAETYFARPQPRMDDAAELATLFRPYWRARLAATPDRASIFLRAGLPPNASAAKAARRTSVGDLPWPVKRSAGRPWWKRWPAWRFSACWERP